MYYKVNEVNIKKFEQVKQYIFNTIEEAQFKARELEEKENTGWFIIRVSEDVLYTSKKIHDRIGNA
jgi:hypothetical protein